MEWNNLQVVKIYFEVISTLSSSKCDFHSIRTSSFHGKLWKKGKLQIKKYYKQKKVGERERMKRTVGVLYRELKCP